ncbi:MAG: response regulator [Acidobacteria bacterium]|nr:response regulator [Acidobacteriota bacterium]
MDAQNAVPEKILIVDDEQDFITALAKRLRAKGWDTETASGGKEALEKAAGEDFIAIVLDLKMPGLDGIETLKRLKKINPDLQIILLTGHGSIRDGVDAMKHGALDFLEKPADFKELVQKIKSAKAKRMVLVDKNVEEKITEIMKNKSW